MFIVPKQPLGISQANTTDRLSDGLIASYPFSVPGTDTVHDCSAYHFPLTLANHNAADWKTTHRGWAFDFDGAGDTADVSNALHLAEMIEITLSAWINIDTFVPTRQDIIFNGNNYALYLAGQQLVVEYISSTPLTHTFTSTANVITATDTWFHVAARIGFEDGNKVGLFVNGVEVAGTWTEGDGTELPDLATTLQIGKGTFNGRLQNINIYRRYLPPNEITLLADNPWVVYEDYIPLLVPLLQYMATGDGGMVFGGSSPAVLILSEWRQTPSTGIAFAGITNASTSGFSGCVGTQEIVQVAATADDGYWVNNNTYFTGIVKFGKSFILAAFDPNILSAQAIVEWSSWCRFTGVDIEQGATIGCAFLEFVPSGSSPQSTNVNVRIVAEDVDSGTAPANASQADGKTRTSAGVNWSPGTWTIGTNEFSTNIKTVIQEIVDRSGWNSGNAITILIDENGSDTTSTREATDYTTTPGDATQLTVFWTLNKVVVPTGGLRFDGSATIGLSYTPTGGMVFGGGAVIVFAPTYTGTGGMLFSGTASYGVSIIPEGGMVFSGTAPHGVSIIPEGGMVFGGAANIASSVWVYTGTGGLTLAGDATEDISGWDYVPTGGMVFGGAALITFPNWGYVPSGGMVFAGYALLEQDYSFTGTGGMLFDGDASTVLALLVTGSGGLVLSGEAVFTVHLVTIACPNVFDNLYTYRKLVTIPDGKVSSDLTDFPVLVSVTLDDAQPIYKAQGNEGISFGGNTTFVSTNWRAAPTAGLAFKDDGDTNTHAGSGVLALSGVAPIRYGIGRNDISFEDRNRITLAYEIDNYDPITGQLLAWVKLPTLYQKSANEFYVYYGKADKGRHYNTTTEGGMVFGGSVADVVSSDYRATGSGGLLINETGAYSATGTGGLALSGIGAFFYQDNPDRQNSFNSWNNGFEAVYHLGDATNAFADSSGNALHGSSPTTDVSVSTSIYYPARWDGKVYKGQHFDGNDHIQTGQDSIYVADSVTIEGWVKADAVSFVRRCIFSRGKEDTVNGLGWSFSLGYSENGKVWANIQAEENDGDWVTVETLGATTIAANTWYHFAAVWNSGSTLKVYLDGVEDGSTTTTQDTFVAYGVGNFIGRRDAGFYHGGELDEIRLSNVARSADWIKATRDNTNAPASFVTISLQQGALGFGGLATITVDRVSYVTTGGLTLSGTSESETTTFGFAGTGGLTLAGQAPIGRPYTGTGGLTLAGDATEVVGSWRFVGSGGLTLSGTATIGNINKKAVGSGGLTLSGTAVFAFGFVGSGGLSFGGSATLSISKEYTGTGGLTFGGSAVGPARVMWGSITLAGSATQKQGYSITPTGGLTFAGTAGFGFGYIATGGLSFGGSATLDLGKDAVGSGGLTLAGTAIGPARVVWGGLTLAGSAEAQASPTVSTPKGGLALAGSATLRRIYTVTPTSGLSFGGNAGLSIRVAGSGGLVLSGSAPIRWDATGVGGLTFGGSGVIVRSFSTTPTGGLVLSGVAQLSTWFTEGDGGLIFGGSILEGPRSYIIVPTGGLEFIDSSIKTDFAGSVTNNSVFDGTITSNRTFAGRLTIVSAFDGVVT